VLSSFLYFIVDMCECHSIKLLLTYLLTYLLISLTQCWTTVTSKIIGEIADCTRIDTLLDRSEQVFPAYLLDDVSLGA